MPGRDHLSAVQSAEIEQSIVDYLHRHPEAADTLDGIVNWWLPLQRYVNTKKRIEQVLAKLTADGILSSDTLPDGAVLYTLGGRRVAQRREH